jgi:hypothetical protein
MRAIHRGIGQNIFRDEQDSIPSHLKGEKAMKSLGLILIVALLCWTGIAFSQSEENPFDKSPAELAAKAMESNSQPSPVKEALPTANQNGEEQEPPLVLRFYDVSDVIAFAISDYPAKRLNDLGDDRLLFPEANDPIDMTMPNMYSGLASGSSHAIPKPPLASSGDDLGNLISRIVSPSQWDQVGGSSAFRIYKGMLVVSAPEKEQAQIHSLLAQIRAHIASRKTVVVETHWLWLTEEQLNRLVPNSSGEVDERAWKIHQQQLNREDSELMPGYHATIICMNGQTASTVAGRQRRFIISLIPVVGDNGISPTPIMTTPFSVGETNSRAVGYQPQSLTVQEGAALQVRPILFGEDQVILDIHGRVVEVETPDQNETLPAGQLPKKADDNRGSDIRDIVKAVDRPVVNTSRIDTTFRAPLGTRTLVGGITGSTHPEPDEPSLYLFAKVTVKEPLKESQKNR